MSKRHLPDIVPGTHPHIGTSTRMLNVMPKSMFWAYI